MSIILPCTKKTFSKMRNVEQLFMICYGQSLIRIYSTTLNFSFLKSIRSLVLVTFVQLEGVAMAISSYSIESKFYFCYFFQMFVEIFQTYEKWVCYQNDQFDSKNSTPSTLSFSKAKFIGLFRNDLATEIAMYFFLICSCEILTKT